MLHCILKISAHKLRQHAFPEWFTKSTDFVNCKEKQKAALVVGED